MKNALQIINVDDIDTNVSCAESLLDSVFLRVPTLDSLGAALVRDCRQRAPLGERGVWIR